MDDVDPPAPRPPAAPVRLEEGETVVAVLQSSARRGPWTPPERMRVVSVLGSVVLDYREADLPAGITEVDCAVYLGSVAILVPPDVDVELTGSVLLGSMETKDDAEMARAREHLRARTGGAPADRAPESERPLLSVDCAGVMGSVAVRLG